MKTISKYMLIVLALSIFGCKKYLDAKPDDTLTTPENLSALQALLDNGQYMNGSSPSMGEASADDYYLLQSIYDTRTPVVQAAYTWAMAGVSDYSFANVKDWANLYYTVYTANLCLDELTNISRTTVNAVSWDNVKGSALFFRARAFMQLLWVFSKAYDENTANNDLGIVLRLGSDFNVPSVRSTVMDSYKQTISDLMDAVQYLPDNVSIQTRPSKAAVYGYLARTYLSMREYDSAYQYADACLQLDSNLIDYNDNTLVNFSASFPFKDLNKEIIHECYDNSLSISSIAQKNARIDSVLYNSYNSNDLRKSAFFKINTDGIIFKGSYNARGAWFTGIATDEMYLIRAECLAREGEPNDAMRDLNTVLMNRWKTGTFVPFSATNENDALQIILAERRKELVFRDLRWMDIKRLNKDGAGISIKRIVNGQSDILQSGDNRFALPLPTDIISETNLPQNPQ